MKNFLKALAVTLTVALAGTLAFAQTSVPSTKTGSLSAITSAQLAADDGALMYDRSVNITKLMSVAEMDVRWLQTSGGTLSGSIQLVAGSAAAPSLALGEATTGLYRSAAGRIAFAAGGSYLGDMRAFGTGSMLAMSGSTMDGNFIGPSSLDSYLRISGGSSGSSSGVILLTGVSAVATPSSLGPNSVALRTANSTRLSINGSGVASVDSTANWPFAARAGDTLSGNLGFSGANPTIGSTTSLRISMLGVTTNPVGAFASGSADGAHVNWAFGDAVTYNTTSNNIGFRYGRDQNAATILQVLNADTGASAQAEIRICANSISTNCTQIYNTGTGSANGAQFVIQTLSGVTSGIVYNAATATGKHIWQVQGSAKGQVDTNGVFALSSINIGAATPASILSNASNTSGVTPVNVISAAAEASMGVQVSDGTNNRRAKFFVNQTAGEWGLWAVHSSGAPNFVIGIGGNAYASLTASTGLWAWGLSGGTAVHVVNGGISTTEGLYVTQETTASAATIAALDCSGGFARLSGTTATTIQGIAAPSTSANNVSKYCTIMNLTGQNLTIAHQNGSASAANQITTMTGADSVSTGNSSAILIYDPNSTKWILLSHEL